MDLGTYTLDTKLNVEGIQNGVSRIQSLFDKIDLPFEQKGALTKNFSELTRELSKYQTQIAKGFTSKGDLKNLESSGRKINALFESLEKKVSKIDLQQIHFDVENPQELKDALQVVNELEKKRRIEFQEAGLDKIQSGLNKISSSIGGETKKKVQEAFDAGNIDAFNAGMLKMADLIHNTVDESAQLKSYAEQVKNAFKSGDTAALEKIVTEIQSLNTEVEGESTQKLKNYSKGLLEIAQNSKNIGKIDGLRETTSQLEEARAKASSLSEAYQNELRAAAGNARTAIHTLASKIVEIRNEEERTAESSHAMAQSFDQIKTRLAYFFSAHSAIMLMRRAFQYTLNTVKELDAAMTQTAVVTNFSVGDMWSALPKYKDTANELGVSLKGVYETMTLFYQQGLQTDQVFQIGTETLKMARIAGMDYETATKAMTAALRGFNLELNELSAQRVNDVYSKLAAITASDTGEIATAMEKTASIASNAGMELETTAAFLSQIIETTQEAPETAGTAMKTIIARFTEMKKAAQDVINVDGEEISVNKVDAALKSVGVSLKDVNGQFRDLDDVFLELSSKWDSLDKMSQRYVATMAAGSRQQSRFIAMMSNYGRTMELVNEAQNAEGASDTQFNKTMDSMDAKLNQLQTAWQSFLMGISNSSAIKEIVDVLTKMVDLFTKATTGTSGFITAVSRISAVVTIFKVLSAGVKSLTTNISQATLSWSTFRQGFSQNFNNSIFKQWQEEKQKKQQTEQEKVKAAEEAIVKELNLEKEANVEKKNIYNQDVANFEEAQEQKVAAAKKAVGEITGVAQQGVVDTGAVGVAGAGAVVAEPSSEQQNVAQGAVIQPKAVEEIDLSDAEIKGFYENSRNKGFYGAPGKFNTYKGVVNQAWYGDSNVTENQKAQIQAARIFAKENIIQQRKLGIGPENYSMLGGKSSKPFGKPAYLQQEYNTDGLLNYTEDQYRNLTNRLYNGNMLGNDEGAVEARQMIRDMDAYDELHGKVPYSQRVIKSEMDAQRKIYEQNQSQPSEQPEPEVLPQNEPTSTDNSKNKEKIRKTFRETGSGQWIEKHAYAAGMAANLLGNALSMIGNKIGETTEKTNGWAIGLQSAGSGLSIMGSTTGMLVSLMGPWGVAVAAVIGAITAVISGLSQHKKALEEEKNAAVEAAKAANEKAGKNRDEFKALEETVDDYQNGKASRSEVKEVAEPLIEAYKLQDEEANLLCGTYDKLVEAIKKARLEEEKEVLQKNLEARNKVDKSISGKGAIKVTSGFSQRDELGEEFYNKYLNQINSIEGINARSLHSYSPEIITGIVLNTIGLGAVTPLITMASTGDSTTGMTSENQNYEGFAVDVDENASIDSKIKLLEILIETNEAQKRALGDNASKTEQYQTLTEQTKKYKEELDSLKYSLSSISQAMNETALLNGTTASFSIGNIEGIDDYNKKRQEYINLLKSDSTLQAENLDNSYYEEAADKYLSQNGQANTIQLAKKNIEKALDQSFDSLNYKTKQLFNDPKKVSIIASLNPDDYYDQEGLYELIEQKQTEADLTITTNFNKVGNSLYNKIASGEELEETDLAAINTLLSQIDGTDGKALKNEWAEAQNKGYIAMLETLDKIYAKARAISQNEANKINPNTNTEAAKYIKNQGIDIYNNEKKAKGLLNYIQGRQQETIPFLQQELKYMIAKVESDENTKIEIPIVIQDEETVLNEASRLYKEYNGNIEEAFSHINNNLSAAQKQEIKQKIQILADTEEYEKSINELMKEDLKKVIEVQAEINDFQKTANNVRAYRSLINQLKDIQKKGFKVDGSELQSIQKINPNLIRGSKPTDNGQFQLNSKVINEEMKKMQTTFNKNLQRMKTEYMTKINEIFSAADKIEAFKNSLNGLKDKPDPTAVKNFVNNLTVGEAKMIVFAKKGETSFGKVESAGDSAESSLVSNMNNVSGAIGYVIHNIGLLQQALNQLEAGGTISVGDIKVWSGGDSDGSGGSGKSGQYQPSSPPQWQPATSGGKTKLSPGTQAALNPFANKVTPQNPNNGIVIGANGENNTGIPIVTTPASPRATSNPTSNTTSNTTANKEAAENAAVKTAEDYMMGLVTKRSNGGVITDDEAAKATTYYQNAYKLNSEKTEQSLGDLYDSVVALSSKYTDPFSGDTGSKDTGGGKGGSGGGGGGGSDSKEEDSRSKEDIEKENAQARLNTLKSEEADIDRELNLLQKLPIRLYPLELAMQGRKLANLKKQITAQKEVVKQSEAELANLRKKNSQLDKYYTIEETKDDFGNTQRTFQYSDQYINASEEERKKADEGGLNDIKSAVDTTNTENDALSGLMGDFGGQALDMLNSGIDMAKQAIEKMVEVFSALVDWWTNREDWLYNLLSKIEQETRNFARLQQVEERFRLGSTEGVDELVAAWYAQKESLDKQIALEEELIASRKAELQFLNLTNLLFSPAFHYDYKEERVIENPWVYDIYKLVLKIGSLMPEIGGVFSSLESLMEDNKARMEKAVQDIEDAKDKILEIEKQQLELRQQYMDDEVSLEELVMGKIIEKMQEEIDSMTALSEAISEANSKLLETLQNNLEKMRQDRENANTEEELAKKERRLAYLRQDTSGANQVEIRKLEEELDKGHQDYTDKLIDQKITELQKQNDKAAAQREAQINLAQAQLEYTERYGLQWEEARELIKNGYDDQGRLRVGSELFDLLMSSEDFAGLGAGSTRQLSQRMEWDITGIASATFRAINDVWNKGFLLNNPQSANVHKEEQKPDYKHLPQYLNFLQPAYEALQDYFVNWTGKNIEAFFHQLGDEETSPLALRKFIGAGKRFFANWDRDTSNQSNRGNINYATTTTPDLFKANNFGNKTTQNTISSRTYQNNIVNYNNFNTNVGNNWDRAGIVTVMRDVLGEWADGFMSLLNPFDNSRSH